MKESFENPFFLNSCRRDFSLEKVFKSFNEKYFQGKLPKYKILIGSRCKNFAHLSAGYCSVSDRKIFLRSGVSKNVTPQTLTHEMIHAKLWWLTKNGHGKAFVNELRRVRKLGAPLSSLELDLSEGYEPPKLTKRNIENSIQDALVIEGLPKGQVPNYLEREFYEPISRIRQVADIEKGIQKISNDMKTWAYFKNRKIVDHFS
jgi:SprT-like family